MGWLSPSEAVDRPFTDALSKVENKPDRYQPSKKCPLKKALLYTRKERQKSKTITSGPFDRDPASGELARLGITFDNEAT